MFPRPTRPFRRKSLPSLVGNRLKCRIVVKIASYGTWTSPIDAEDVASAGGGPNWLDMHGAEAWWTEGLPDEGGRLELRRHRDGVDTSRCWAAPWNVRNRLHEYGGRPFAVIDTAGGTRVAFTNWADQRVYLTNPDDDRRPGPADPGPGTRPHGLRYGDLVAGPGGTEVWCVRETVTGELPTDIRRDLVAIPLDGSAAGARTLAASHHFLTAPKPSPDGRHVGLAGLEPPGDAVGRHRTVRRRGHRRRASARTGCSPVARPRRCARSNGTRRTRCWR